MKYIINPKAAYLLEQFSSLEFFEIMRNNHRWFLDSLEELFEIYMHNLPYNLRDLPLPEQADINWGGTVLPNLRSTMDRIDYAYAKIKSGDFTYLGCVGEIRSNDKGLSEFSPHWMSDLPDDKVRQCWDYYSVTRQYASIIEKTYPTYWEMDELINDFPTVGLFRNLHLSLPATYPIYRINPEVTVKSNEKVKKTGIYLCQEVGDRIKFMAASEEEDQGVASAIAIGYDPDTYETLYAEANWILIERIVDEGGTAEAIQVENLKAVPNTNLNCKLIQIINFAGFLLAFLTVFYFNLLYLILGELTSLILYRICHHFKFITIQSLFAFIYGGFSTGLVIKLGIIFWLGKDYHLLIFILPIVAVCFIVFYYELFEKHYALKSIVPVKDGTIDIMMSEKRIEDFFKDTQKVIGLSITRIEKPYNAGLAHQCGSFDFGVSYYIWETSNKKIEVFTKNDICTDVYYR